MTTLSERREALEGAYKALQEARARARDADTITMRREDVAWLHFVASNHVTDQAKQKALQILTTALEEKT